MHGWEMIGSFKLRELKIEIFILKQIGTTECTKSLASTLVLRTSWFKYYSAYYPNVCQAMLRGKPCRSIS